MKFPLKDWTIKKIRSEKQHRSIKKKGGGGSSEPNDFLQVFFYGPFMRIKEAGFWLRGAKFNELENR